MKKILLIMPMFLMVTLAWSQNPGKDPNRVNNSKTLDGKAYKVTLTPSAMDHQMIESNDMNKDKSPVENTDMSKNTYDESGNVVTKENRSDRTTETMKKDYQGKKENNIQESKTVVIRFENGMVTTSLTNSKLGGNCPYNTTKTVDETITFTADCSTTISNSTDDASSSVSSSSKWNGSVEGKNIKGNLYMTDEKGIASSYTFTGTEAKDSTKNLGSK